MTPSTCCVCVSCGVRCETGPTYVIKEDLEGLDEDDFVKLNMPDDDQKEEEKLIINHPGNSAVMKGTAGLVSMLESIYPSLRVLRFYSAWIHYLSAYLYFPWNKRTVVGILPESENDDCEWLANLLRNDVFKDHVSEVKVFRKVEDQQTIMQDVSSLSRVIIYKSGGGGSDGQSDPYHLLTELRKRSPYNALKKVRIVVGDLDNIESAKGNTATRESCQEPILYTKSDVKLFKESQQLLHRTKEKLKQIVTIMTPSQDYLYKVCSLRWSPTTHTVGIFSRDSEENYQWLMDCEDIKRAASTVTACFISSSGYLQFHQDVSQCSFGILYHTKNRGRVNVTDVTDALYNDELRYLSDTLGKENVIVVVDDVDQDTSELKQKILENQPSISTFARELFMFNREGKAVLEKVRVLESWIKYGESLEDKVAGKAESAP
uniref:Uncharacterized protein n=1 Tax=Leptobrachium leishanense TaxID=445787 RepID=A0A8C5Q1P9_9ANUR